MTFNPKLNAAGRAETQPPDPIFVDSIKVSAGPFTVRTASDSGVIVEQKIGRHSRKRRFGFTLEEVELLARALGEYLHMRSME